MQTKPASLPSWRRQHAYSATRCLLTWRKMILTGRRQDAARTTPLLSLDFQPLPSDASQTAALREAIAALSEAGRAELYTLMRIGQGHLAAKKWHRGLSEARLLGDETITAAVLEDVDLHDHIERGLYEAGLFS